MAALAARHSQYHALPVWPQSSLCKRELTSTTSLIGRGMSLPLGARYSYTMQSVSGRESISQYFVSPDLINLIWDLGSRGTIVAWYRIWCRSLPSQVIPDTTTRSAQPEMMAPGGLAAGGPSVNDRTNVAASHCNRSLPSVAKVPWIAAGRRRPVPICEKSRLIICGFMEFTIQQPQKSPRLFQGQWAID